MSLQALEGMKLGLIVKSDAELDTPTPLVAEDKVPPQVLEEQHLELVVKSPKEVKPPPPPPGRWGYSVPPGPGRFELWVSSEKPTRFVPPGRWV